MSPGNKILEAQPNMVYFHHNEHLCTAIEDSITMLIESMLEPTQCSELVMGWPEFVGIMDASGEGVGGVVVGEDAKCMPTVYQMKWTDDIKKGLKTKENPARKLSISEVQTGGPRDTVQRQPANGLAGGQAGVEGLGRDRVACVGTHPADEEGKGITQHTLIHPMNRESARRCAVAIFWKGAKVTLPIRRRLANLV